jgi:hypothetical protein
LRLILSESGGSRSIHFSSQDLQKGKAIIDRTMALMKITCLPEQISELGAFISVCGVSVPLIFQL